MSKPVIVATYLYPHEAHIARASLESAGIPAVLADEHLVSTDWLYAHAVGGVKLLVDEPRVPAAKRILEADYSEAVDDEYGTESPTCPACGSQDCEPYTQGKKPAFVVFLLLGFPLFFLKQGMKCSNCGEFWQESAKHDS